MSWVAKNISGLIILVARIEVAPMPSTPRDPGKTESRRLLRADFRGDDRYYFVRATYEPGGAYGTPSQRGYQLVAMLGGRARIEVEGEAVLLREGEGILVRPGWRLLYLFSEDETSIHTGCQATPAAFSAAERRALAELRGAHPLPAAIHTLIEEGLAAPPVANAIYHAAQLLLAKACLLRFAAHVSGGAAAVAPPHLALHRARQVLETAPFELKTAGDLAARAGVSVSRLRQLYREQGGESPSALIWRIKTEHAVRMIRSTGLSLGEIAAQTGFANPFHLSRSVKKLTGQSPRGLRRIEWGAAPT
jgi:AraC-like DNA-binding protein/quercetin dioxygenase-like cupin family protein